MPPAPQCGKAEGMAALASRSVRLLGGLLLSVAIAAALVAGATLVRAALSPQLGALSPFMLYVAAVLVAGLARGPFCGVLVMLAGGACGLRFFLTGEGADATGSITALMIFWGVSALVLATANELRVHIHDTMQRLAAALRRHDGRGINI